jgi:hypothetical protein
MATLGATVPPVMEDKKEIRAFWCFLPYSRPFE